MNVFQQMLYFTNYTFLYRRESVIAFIEVKFLWLSKSVLENVLVIFHEFHGNPLEERAINRHIFQVCEAF